MCFYHLLIDDKTEVTGTTAGTASAAKIVNKCSALFCNRFSILPHSLFFVHHFQQKAKLAIALNKTLNVKD